ncbi:hypothetical protein [Kytococcus sedentarius]|uniref:hypothetical protein n=1 Tax=Kytococcus sedentarius TaxID=1276 RepID=UPI00384DBEBB
MPTHPSAHGAQPLTNAADTVLLALRPVFSTLVTNTIVLGICLAMVVTSGGLDDPWPMWGLLAGLMAFVNVLGIYPALGKVANSVPLSRPVVVAMFLVLVGGVAVVSGIAAALLGRFEPPPGVLGDAWLTPTLLALAAGAWIGASAVPLMFAGLLPFLLAFLLAVVMCIVALAGALAPMLLVVFGSESMVNLAILSPVVTLPLMVVMLLLVPLQRLAPRSR